jgi:hypothetical protein
MELNMHRAAVFAAAILAVCLLVCTGCGTGGGTVDDPGTATPDNASASSREAPAFDTSLAMEHIDRLSVGIGPRVSGTPEEHLAAAYIRDSFSRMGYAEVEEQPFPSGPGLTSYNVYAVDEGARPEWVVVVGAHYDTADATGSPGANDNASGVGVVLELARAFRDRDNLPTLVFAAFGSEEVSEEYDKDDLEYGSAYMAGQLESLGGEVIGMVNLDMVGVGEAAIAYATLEAPGTFSDLFLDFAEERGEEVGFVRDPGDWSDNEAFEEEGISSFTLEWQLDQDYHTPRDVYGNVDPSLIGESGQLIEAFLIELGAFDCRLLERSADRGR